METKRTLITSALPYANGYLHLGHIAGAYLPADIYARYLRLKGEEVLWICGSDEHGVAITIAAEIEKTTPEQIIEKYHISNMDSFEKFGISFDFYSRTSIPIHHQTAKEFFRDLLKKGYLIEKEEEQFYDSEANFFLPDRYVEGVCPNCGYEHARGDQCDSCGAYYNQIELKNPISLISGKKPEVKSTIHWYMRFGMFQEFLEKYIESHAKDWKENVIRQSHSWLKRGLSDRAITRDLSWGVKIEDIEEIPSVKTKGKVLYVWFDAVLGYISATKVWAINRAGAHRGTVDDWQIWWKSPETRYVAFIGKDNIVFHTLIFPAMLHARQDNYILPDNVPANEFLNLEGEKFSKSRNWSIDLKDFIADFPNPNDIDALRYTLAMNFPETKDSDFTWKDFQARTNNELSAILGNFVNRTLQFLIKNFDSEVPTLSDTYKNLPNDWKNVLYFAKSNRNEETEFFADIENDFLKVYSSNDLQMVKALFNGIKLITENYDKFRFRDGLTETMNIARAANKYFNDEEPWKTVKENPEVCGKTLYICSQIVYSLSILIAPVLPNTSAKISSFFARKAITGSPDSYTVKTDYWLQAGVPNLPEGLKVQEPALLFQKIEDSVIQNQIDKLGKKQEAKETIKQELINYEDFAKVKLRTAKILEAENVKKSKKLLRLIVDLGDEKRQIVAGIAEHYQPQDLIGKIIVVVSNLAPAKLMGVESNGMLLAATDSDGKLSFLTPADTSIGHGAEVK